MNLITVRQITPEEIKKSQNENLTSKKTRQRSRFHLYRMFGFRIPIFDGGYHNNRIDILTEIKIFTKHRVRSILEKLHVFTIFYRFFINRN